MIVTGPDADPLNSTVQVELELVSAVRTQEAELGETSPAPASVKLTSPEGEVAPLAAVLVTVAVHVMFWLTIIDSSQTRLVDVDCIPGVIVAVP